MKPYLLKRLSRLKAAPTTIPPSFERSRWYCVSCHYPRCWFCPPSKRGYKAEFIPWNNRPRTTNDRHHHRVLYV